MESLNVLVIGAGKIARRHLTAWRGLTDGRLGVYDVVPGRARLLGSDTGAVWVEDLDAAVTGEAFEVIDVCVPTQYHAEYVLGALAAGKHVFVEKPLCTTVAEGERILAAAREAERWVQVGYLFRYHPAFKQAKTWLDAHIIGQPHLVLVRMGGRGSAALWKHRRGEGGGVINEMVVHKLDLLRWFFPDVQLRAVHMRDTILPTRMIDGSLYEVDAEDFLLAELASGTTRIVLQGDLATPAYQENVEIHGENGSIVVSIVEGFRNFVYLKEPRAGLNSGYHYQECGSVDLFWAELTDFVEMVDRKPSQERLVDAVAQVRVLAQLRGGV